MTGRRGRFPRRRVVVTGTGVISPVGLSTDEFWRSLLAGRSGVGPITRFDASDLPTRIAAEVRGFDPTVYQPRHLARRADPFAQYAFGAGMQAVELAGLTVSERNAERVGVLIGSGYGPGSMVQRNTLALDTVGPRAVAPYLAAFGSIDAAAGQLAMRLGAKGPSGAISTACATGATCIGEGMRQIQYDVADVVIAGGADDTPTRLDLVSVGAVGALSRRNDDPTRASRPFDRGRDGFVMGAGAGVVVLEEEGHARRRGAAILAEIVGYGAATDVHHPTAPDPGGRAAMKAMRLALDDAGLRPEDVDHINAHGTGTLLNDRVEAIAIRGVFGKRATQIPISAVKSMTGHLIGAAGAVEFIATVQAIRDGVVPPTINCDDPEDRELDHVPHQPQQRAVRVAISNSFGFAGHNAVLAVRAWTDD